MDLDDEELKPGEIFNQPLGQSEYSPVAAGTSHSLIDSDDDLYNDLSSSNKPSFLQHRDPSSIPSSLPQISGTDSPSSMTSPLLPLNPPLDYHTCSTPGPAAPPSNINQPPDISLDSPPRNSALARLCTFIARESPPQDVDDNNGFGHMDLQPESSGSESIKGVMKSLTVHSHKASGSALCGRSPATSTHRSVGPSPSGSRSTSESHKQLHNIGADVTKKLADASDSLLLHVQNKSDVKASSKQMKFEYARFSKELKACEAHAERKHDSHQVMANLNHERAISEDKTRQLELEI
ncbi:hypothetical protein DFJ58DRAFT_735648 [Suillus subalutaceus]|uniref:uncharacterized protein n=1 Tax=Suillus subalutaceus TaxID=48586 RepID=UPI001B863B54|nr:uncharacterized protein DFJ58DRAFT_735648 [Suillus subalutaceus]KAG1835019.1 hypothetical protein DFJ58DRAFT_735648 [Suillus subalutaceus]